VDADTQIRYAKENAEKRRIWEQEHARQKEQRRLQYAREELALEKKRRLESWMSGGGDPESFERAWPSMQTAILQERYQSRHARAEDVWS